MQEPVPLADDDLDPGVSIERTIDPDELGKKGYVQYYFHHKNSELPVRDVNNTMDEGYKKEPCFERKADNYCCECLPKILSNVVDESERRYIFLFTKCQNRNIPEYKSRRITGYIEKRRILDINGRKAIQGPMKVVSFQQSFPLERIGIGDIRGFKRIDESRTNTILTALSDAKNLYEEYVNRIEELEKEVARPRLWEDEKEKSRKSTTVDSPGEEEIYDGSAGC
jgi:hypothetical protein